MNFQIRATRVRFINISYVLRDGSDTGYEIRGTRAPYIADGFRFEWTIRFERFRTTSKEANNIAGRIPFHRARERCSEHVPDFHGYPLLNKPSLLNKRRVIRLPGRNRTAIPCEQYSKP